MITHKESIINISGQTRKWTFFIRLLLGASVMMFLGIVAIAFEPQLFEPSFGFMRKEIGGVLIFAAMLIGSISTICLSMGIKCPQCKLRWFWYGLAKDFKRNIMIGHMSHCPRCNYPEPIDSGVSKDIDKIVG